MTSSATSTPAKSRAPLVITIAVLAALVVGFFIFAGLYADVLWFDQLGFLSVLTTQWFATAIMFVIGFLGMAIPVWVSVQVAFRWRPVYAKLNAQLDRYQQLIEPLRKLAMWLIPAVFGLFAGLAAASRWPVALQWLHRTPFGETDPQFGLDIGFYVFELPFYRSVVAFASAAVLISLLAALATSYLYGAIRVNGREVRISRTARVQLAVTAGIYLLLQGVSLWLDQYATLAASSEGFLANGAGYTEVNAIIPGKAILAGIALLVALLFFVTAVIGRWRLPIVGTALLVVSALVVGVGYPFVVQRLQVVPTEGVLESPYIDRHIQATRDAYGVSDVQEVSYNAVTDATPGALREDAQTTANIRIIDPALVTDAFGQLQQFRNYYDFGDHLDVDRYSIDGRITDTVIAVRELNQGGLPSSSWYNNTIVYTHGYGVVAAYGNQRSVDGQPVFLESDIPSVGGLGDYEPRVYFGEQSPEYSIVGAPAGTPAVEFDYPAGDDEGAGNTTTTFDGDGGPDIGNFFNRLVYAIKFQSEQIVLSDAVNSESQILYDRDPRERVSKVAPYLTLDNDAYPAIVDERLVWIVDGYTTTAAYPYSRVEQLSDVIADTYTPQPIVAFDDINYIRNSVKATVDAYDGSVTLYAWDEEDPLLQTWQKIFPSTVEPLSNISGSLMSHVRYPADLFKVQRAILGSYHVTSPSSFFANDDAWVSPNEPTATGVNPPLQPPYYLTMQMPGEDSPAFSLYSTYIPRGTAESTRNVLFGYLSANADAGAVDGTVSDDYGRLTLLNLPKQNTVPGPGQVQANFNADPTVSRELNLLRQGETQVISGNLLTLPVGGGLLYVQPVYVQSRTETSYPLLQKVLVAFGDQIAFEDTLDAALDTLFGGDSGANAGDTDIPVTPGPGTDEPGTEEPGTEEPGTEEPGTETPGTGTALQVALQDAAQALRDRTAAYAANDLVAAAEADKRLQEALERAIAASE